MKFFLFSCMVPFFSLFADTVEIVDDSPLRVGTASGYAPYVSLDTAGVYEGFDIDLAQQLGKKLGRKVIFQDFGSMPSLMLALKQEKVDVLIWAISITEERLKNLEMIHYQGEAIREAPFLFWKKIPEGIRSIEDLQRYAEKGICIEGGSFQEEVLKKFPALRLKYVDKVTDVIMEIKFGKSFTTTIDSSLIPRLKDKYPDLQVLNLPLPSESQSFGNGICLNKGAHILAAQIRKAIGELREEGTILILEKKWKLVD